MASILVVDDEKDICDLMAEAFEDEGHQVMTSFSGKDAFKMTQTHQFDLVISDLGMGDGDGLFLLESLKELSTKRPQLIFITGYTDMSAEELRAKGARAIFQKPLNFDDFFSSINSFLCD